MKKIRITLYLAIIACLGFLLTYVSFAIPTHSNDFKPTWRTNDDIRNFSNATTNVYFNNILYDSSKLWAVSSYVNGDEVYEMKTFYFSNDLNYQSEVLAVSMSSGYSTIQLNTINSILLIDFSEPNQSNTIYFDRSAGSIYNAKAGTLNGDDSIFVFYVVADSSIEAMGYVSEMRSSLYFSNDDLRSLVTRLTPDNYQAGYDNGVRDGATSGKEQGLHEGESIGYKRGYDEARGLFGIFKDNQWISATTWGQQQFNQGQTTGTDFFSILFSGMFGFITHAGAIELLPGLRIWHLVAVPLVFGIIYFIVGKNKGGD